MGEKLQPELRMYLPGREEPRAGVRDLEPQMEMSLSSGSSEGGAHALPGGAQGNDSFQDGEAYSASSPQPQVATESLKCDQSQSRCVESLKYTPYSEDVAV